MTVQLCEDDLRRAFDEATLRKAAAIRARDGVGHVEASTEGYRISASVLGSRPKPYSQTITLTQANGGLRIKGYCSCPVGVNCKHAAAVLMKYFKLEDLDDDKARPTGMARAVPAPAPHRCHPGRAPRPAPGSAQA